MTKLILYGLITIASTLGVISSAFRSYSNFYAVAVYLSNSNGASLILGNFALFSGLCIGKIIQKLLFGELRTLETEHLYERSWYGFTEMILAMTMFRDEFDLFYGLMFGFLFFVKVFHWLSHDRMEYMVQYQNASNSIAVRLAIAYAGLLVTDFVLLSICVLDIYLNGVTMIILFASEYAILLADALTGSIRLAINLKDLRSGQAWEDKSLYILYVDIFADFLKLTIYTVFFSVMALSFGLPLNLIRDLVLTTRSFATRIKDLQRYKSASKNMDRLYKAATVEELDALSDKLCIICRDDLIHESLHQGPWPSGLDETPKKLPCSHIFHRHCLKSWLERQQTCPTWYALYFLLVTRTSVVPNAQNERSDRPNNGNENERPRTEPRREVQPEPATRTQPQPANTNENAQQSNANNSEQSSTNTGSRSTSNQTPQPSPRPSSSANPFNTIQTHPMSHILNIPNVTLPIIRPESRALPSTYWRDVYRNAHPTTKTDIPSIVTNDGSTESLVAENVPLPPSPSTSEQETDRDIDRKLTSLLEAQTNINKAIGELVGMVKDSNKRERRSSDVGEADNTSSDAETKRARIN
ncbi:hypothetical protein E3Q08_03582 [Wallemia mellicola]|uniref:RING-type E3 ubiquitin transferase n=1 Tax=Wallemia mellicola TaxID=1708541 RepID=A0AB38MYW9_9BASI|nr:hypothetical protein E3Q24_03447 [Wallemia mellicola]TIB88798.1 hypothetical protein E3Q21_00802 [Wallemia mellicola]TIB91446.1 hypothetical protein E3Q20_00788 [Wallemia mellicola]TIC07161.1 hypothetical protein E3Q16_00650 [Wallemia mellicola]TIC25911.1 hypothetical protein E3Q12_00773 [Wallemia mellicola]